MVLPRVSRTINLNAIRQNRTSQPSPHESTSPPLSPNSNHSNGHHRVSLSSWMKAHHGNSAKGYSQLDGAAANSAGNSHQRALSPPQRATSPPQTLPGRFSAQAVSPSRLVINEKGNGAMSQNAPLFSQQQLQLQLQRLQSLPRQSLSPQPPPQQQSPQRQAQQQVSPQRVQQPLQLSPRLQPQQQPSQPPQPPQQPPQSRTRVTQAPPLPLSPRRTSVPSQSPPHIPISHPDQPTKPLPSLHLPQSQQSQQSQKQNQPHSQKHKPQNEVCSTKPDTCPLVTPPTPQSRPLSNEVVTDSGFVFVPALEDDICDGGSESSVNEVDLTAVSLLLPQHVQALSAILQETQNLVDEVGARCPKAVNELIAVLKRAGVSADAQKCGYAVHNVIEASVLSETFIQSPLDKYYHSGDLSARASNRFLSSGKRPFVTSHPLVNMLRAVDVLFPLSDHNLTVLAAQITEESYKADQTIIQQHERTTAATTSMLVIASGEARSTFIDADGREESCVLQKGDWMNELALSCRAAPCASLRARNAVKLWRIPFSVFSSAVREFRSFEREDSANNNSLRTAQISLTVYRFVFNSSHAMSGGWNVVTDLETSTESIGMKGRKNSRKGKHKLSTTELSSSGNGHLSVTSEDTTPGSWFVVVEGAGPAEVYSTDTVHTTGDDGLVWDKVINTNAVVNDGVAHVYVSLMALYGTQNRSSNEVMTEEHRNLASCRRVGLGVCQVECTKAGDRGVETRVLLRDCSDEVVGQLEVAAVVDNGRVVNNILASRPVSATKSTQSTASNCDDAKRARKEAERHQVLEEIISTEEKYVQSLQLLMELFAWPLNRDIQLGSYFNELQQKFQQEQQQLPKPATEQQAPQPSRKFWGKFWDRKKGDTSNDIDKEKALVLRQTITRLIAAGQNVSVLREVFTTYRCFTTAKQLFDRLQQEYENSTNSESTRDAVVAVLDFWVRQHSSDFHHDRTLFAALANLPLLIDKRTASDPKATTHAEKIRGALQEAFRVQTNIDKQLHVPRDTDSFGMLFARLSRSASDVLPTLLDVMVQHVATQLTCTAQRLFCAIQPSEFFDFDSSKPSLQTNLGVFLHFSKQITCWTQVEILQHHSPNNRAQTIQKLVELLKLSLESGNFLVARAVARGLRAFPVSRLRQTWVRLLESTWTDLQFLLTSSAAEQDSSSNFQLYREALGLMCNSVGQQGIVPDPEILIQDFDSISDGSNLAPMVLCQAWSSNVSDASLFVGGALGEKMAAVASFFSALIGLQQNSNTEPRSVVPWLDFVHENLVSESQLLEASRKLEQTSSSSIITEPEWKTLFSDFSEILQIHQQYILPPLLRARANQNSGVGQVFASNALVLKRYQPYLSTLDERSRLLTQLKASNAALSQFLKCSQQDPRLHGTSLTDLLAKPFQRLTKYKIILERVLDCADSSWPEYEAMQLGLQRVWNISKEINESQRNAESRKKVQEIGEIVKNSIKDFLQPSRTFVREDRITLRDMRVRLLMYTFSDSQLLRGSITEDEDDSSVDELSCHWSQEANGMLLLLSEDKKRVWQHPLSQLVLEDMSDWVRVHRVNTMRESRVVLEIEFETEKSKREWVVQMLRMRVFMEGCPLRGVFSALPLRRSLHVAILGQRLDLVSGVFTSLVMTKVPPDNVSLRASFVGNRLLNSKRPTLRSNGGSPMADGPSLEGSVFTITTTVAIRGELCSLVLRVLRGCTNDIAPLVSRRCDAVLVVASSETTFRHLRKWRERMTATNNMVSHPLWVILGQHNLFGVPKNAHRESFQKLSGCDLYLEADLFCPIEMRGVLSTVLDLVKSTRSALSDEDNFLGSLTG